MAKVRVYELAKEFGVESKVIMAELGRMGEFVRAASSTVEAPAVRQLMDTFALRRLPGDRSGMSAISAAGIAGLALDEVAGHAFISYVREDKDDVDQLQQALEAAGVPVWRDIRDLQPGHDWKLTIRHAISDDALAFVACFSQASIGKRKSYQNDELRLAIDQFRQIPPGQPWLIPVRFDHCDIPDFDLGGGRTLAAIQYADLFGDTRADHTARLVRTILQILGRAPDRTPDGARSAAEQITDTLYARDRRPVVAPPPAYTAAPPIPGLAQADSALLSVLIEEALATEILVVSWPASRAKAEERGMTSSAIDEAFAALQNRHFLKIRSIAGGPHTVELSAAAFRRGVDAVVPGAEAARRQIVAVLVNDPPTGDRPVHSLAELTSKPVLFILQFLKELERQGDLRVSQYLGGFSRITVSPTLKRLL